MHIGHDIMPLELCMRYAGIYLDKLPAEINHHIAEHAFNTKTSDADMKMLLREFSRRCPNLFKKILKQMWKTFQSKYNQYNGSFYQFIQDVKNLKYETNALTTIPEISMLLLNSMDDIWNHPWIISGVAKMLQFQNNRDLAITMVKKRPMLSRFSPTVLDDEKVVMTAVQLDGTQLEYSSERLQDKESIVLAAVENNPMALCFASQRLRDSEHVVMTALNFQIPQVSAFQYASPRLKDDLNCVMAAVQKNGYNIKYASPRLQECKAVALVAVEQNSDVLFLPPMQKFNDDFEVVSIAAKKLNHVRILVYASRRLQDDESIVEAMVKQDGMILESASQRLRNMKSIVKIAVQSDGCALEYADIRLKDDEEIVRIAIQSNSEALQYASIRLQQFDDIFF